MTIISRRRMLVGLFAAPAIVRASSLMKISAPPPPRVLLRDMVETPEWYLADATIMRSQIEISRSGSIVRWVKVDQEKYFHDPILDVYTPKETT